MHSSRSFAGLALVVALTGCFSVPATRTGAVPPPKPQEDPRIRKLALILRASDLRDAHGDLHALLLDADPSVRAKAVLALGQIGEPASVADLITAASDSEAEIRANAAFALGLIGDPASEPALEKLATDSAAEVRASAVDGLGRLNRAVGRPVVGKLLEDPQMPVRAAAALAAWKISEPEPLLDALVSGLSSPDASVRTASSYALARLGSAAVAPPSSGAVPGHLSETALAKVRAALVARVRDADPDVRMNVARGLASPRAGPEQAAVGALSNDAVPGVRVNAVRSLGYPGIPVKPYLERAIGDHDQAVARAALEAIGNVGGSQAAGSLNQLLRKLESGWLREAALLSLAKADPGKTATIVGELLANPDPRMRSAAAELVAGRSEPGALHAGLALLSDPSPRVAALGVPIVASQEGPVSRLLGTFVKAKDPVVRAAVGDAIGDRFAHPHGTVETTDDLFALLEEIWHASSGDTMPDAKLAVLDAASKAGRQDKTRAVLTRALEDPDVIVRKKAVSSLKDLFGEDKSKSIAPASDRPIEDYERIVRFSAIPHAAIVSVQRPGTAIGRFTVALDSSAAPMAAFNFAELAGKAFFDGVTVHRVVPNFVMQDGDPRGDGFGGPGYSIRDEFNPLRFTTGVLGMASDGKDTAGSQWFVTLSAQPHLDGRYTSFGRVVRGFREIVTQIRPGDTIVSIRVYEGSGSEPLPAN